MAEYAQPTASRRDPTQASARSSVRPPRSFTLDQPHEMSEPDTLQAAVKRSPRARGLVQLQRTINQSPRVQALAQLRTMVARSSRPAQPAEPAARIANHTGLPDALKAGLETLSRLSMDDVRVHYNSPKPATVQAHAYAQGTDIHLAPGQERHLPHEAWHVVQQKQGRVKPTLQIKGVEINDDPGLEREAGVLADAIRAPGGSRGGVDLQSATIPRPVLQGFWPLVAAGLAGAAGLAYAFRRPLGNLARNAYYGLRPLGNLARNAYYGLRRRGMLNELLEEARATENLPNVHVTQDPALVSGMRHDGQFRVNVNPNIPITSVNPFNRDEPFAFDPDTLETARVHELTHVAVARGYAGRNLADPATPLNMLGPESAPAHALLLAGAQRFEQIFRTDPVVAVLPVVQRQFILARLQYMQGVKHIEFDSVVNELVYYFYLKGIPPRSPLSQALTEAARERKDERDL